MIYTCINKSYKIYIMQLVTKIQSFWRDQKYQRDSGNARLYLLNSKREWSIFGKKIVSALLKR